MERERERKKRLKLGNPAFRGIAKVWHFCGSGKIPFKSRLIKPAILHLLFSGSFDQGALDVRHGVQTAGHCVCVCVARCNRFVAPAYNRI